MVTHTVDEGSLQFVLDDNDNPVPVQGAKDIDGNDVMSVILANPVGILEPIIITCDGAADIFTDPTAPLAAELFKVTGFSSGAKRARITWLQQEAAAVSDIPFSSMAVATINATTDATAITRLTVPNNGVGTHSTFKGQRSLSKDYPMIEWELLSTDPDIDDIYIGFLPPVGAGAIPIRLQVEVW